MSSFGDEQLNNMAMSIEEIEVYMGRISRAMEELVKLQATINNMELVKGEWKKQY